MGGPDCTDDDRDRCSLAAVADVELSCWSMITSPAASDVVELSDTAGP